MVPPCRIIYQGLKESLVVGILEDCSAGKKPGAFRFGRCWPIPKSHLNLHEILDKGYRMDHNAGLISMRKGVEGHLLHGSFGPGSGRHQYYIF